MITIKEIKQQAHSLNGCAKVDGMRSWADVAKTLLSPQGREFAVKHSFPSLAMFKSSEGLDKHGIFVDKGEMAFDGYDIVAVGNTEVTINACKNDELHHIMLFHGAKAKVVAGKYAVVNITKIGECKCEVVNDGTARVYDYER